MNGAFGLDPHHLCPGHRAERGAAVDNFPLGSSCPSLRSVAILW